MWWCWSSLNGSDDYSGLGGDRNVHDGYDDGDNGNNGGYGYINNKVVVEAWMRT